jgi:hypothetical protein
MQRRILGQSRGARGMLYDPPTSGFPTYNWFLLYFEVLEATRNLTEEALAGGGFYSSEGFSFTNM